MLKKRVVAAVAAALVAGGVSAVEVNPGNRGDVLLAPMVMVSGGWESELRLINTDRVNSTVVKVAFHAANRSEEILDFMVFLTPGDVWRGSAVKNADGTLGVRSSDDSSLLFESTGTCPAAGAAASVGFDPAVVKSSVPADFAYVKVWQSAVVTGLGDAPVAKTALFNKYRSDCNTGERTSANIVAGDVTISNPQNGNMMTLPMTALANVQSQIYENVKAPSTWFGMLANTTKAQVEDALWSNDFVIPYNVSAGSTTFATVTFPTKETYAGAAATQYNGFQPAGRAPTVALQIRNEEERMIGVAGCLISPCTPTQTNTLPQELNVLEIAGGAGQNSASKVFTEGFTRGWVNMNIEPDLSTARSAANYNNFGQAGAPALVTVINWVARGNSLQGSWNYAAKNQAPTNN